MLDAMAWVVLFVFHAEDGIRDWSVTGVQTCALPIFEEDAILVGRHAAQRLLEAEDDRRMPDVAAPPEYLGRRWRADDAPARLGTGVVAGSRSEERRVGKGGWSRWTA